MSEVREILASVDEDMLCADGFDAAIIGYTYDAETSTNRTIYSIDKMVEILVGRDEMEETEAQEYLSHNTLFAAVGQAGPIYMYPLDWVRESNLELEGEQLELKVAAN